MSEWISVKDKLPEPDVDVLITWDYKNKDDEDNIKIDKIDFITSYNSAIWNTYTTDSPTHWMPIPKFHKDKDDKLSKLIDSIERCPITYGQPIIVGLQPYGIIRQVKELAFNKVIQVTFIDGDVQKAVCSNEDEFDFERGIEVCICKHFLGGTKEFNKQLKQGLKCWDDACETEMDRLQEEARIAKKKQKRAERKLLRERQRAAEERERQIEILTDAILRANDIKRIREQ